MLRTSIANGAAVATSGMMTSTTPAEALDKNSLAALLADLESKLSQLERSSLTRVSRLRKLAGFALCSWVVSTYTLMETIAAQHALRELSGGLVYHYATLLPPDSSRLRPQAQHEFFYGVLAFLRVWVDWVNFLAAFAEYVITEVLGWEGTLVAAAVSWFLLLPFAVKTTSQAKESLRKSLAARHTRVAMRKADRRASFLMHNYVPSNNYNYQTSAAQVNAGTRSSAPMWSPKPHKNQHHVGGISLMEESSSSSESESDYSSSVRGFSQHLFGDHDELNHVENGSGVDPDFLVDDDVGEVPHGDEEEEDEEMHLSPPLGSANNSVSTSNHDSVEEPMSEPMPNSQS
ncbi:unnamed protein product [Amoebophrya sp. A120]|nr:unnamed protein product [Amoebophrya sp. A120]|eukprot:GSA120T00024738001.1